MIDPLRNIRRKLAHHLTAEDDPCQDRGVSWPCDVADALGPDADTDVLQLLGEFYEDDEGPAAVAAAFEAGERGLTRRSEAVSPSVVACTCGVLSGGLCSPDPNYRFHGPRWTPGDGR